jgi:SPP1 gp7 family putative phage head morphogenesis protein
VIAAKPPLTRAFKPLLTCGRQRESSPQGQRRRAVDGRAKKARGKPKIGRATENYERSLGQVGAHIGELIDAFPVAQRVGNEELLALLHDYSRVLRPWARQVSARMIEEVNARDIETWRSLAKGLPQRLATEIQSTPVGVLMANYAAEQTELIASLPIEAAQRVQRLTLTGLIEGEQLARITRLIENSGEVSKAHAQQIARTEVSRTASNLTQARAAVAGLPRYRWRATQDRVTRPAHRAMEGKICEWANPPEIDEGGRLMAFHPGCIWECRCWAEILIEDR